MQKVKRELYNFHAGRTDTDDQGSQKDQKGHFRWVGVEKTF
jgi:hypothetical protein